MATLGALISMCVVAFINWKFDKRFDHLDRDVQAIAKVVFPEN